jgi:hypothetical protein
MCVSNEKKRKLLVQQDSNVPLFYCLVNTKLHSIAHTSLRVGAEIGLSGSSDKAQYVHRLRAVWRQIRSQPSDLASRPCE